MSWWLPQPPKGLNTAQSLCSEQFFLRAHLRSLLWFQMFCVAIYLACKQAAKNVPHNDGEGNRNYIVAGTYKRSLHA